MNKSYALHDYEPESDDFTDFEFIFFVLSCTIYNQFAAINQQNAQYCSLDIHIIISH